MIAGREEARLIYIGASHSLPASRDKRLVVDIGGGSTEFIVGRQHTPLVTESTVMGCVSWSRRFFLPMAPLRPIDWPPPKSRPVNISSLGGRI